jgi:hypothetical protein
VSETPSARRRKGRNAYYRGGYPNELNPYKDASHACDWRQGWDEAERDDKIVQQDESELERRRQEPISLAIDAAETDDDVKEILRRIALHVGME